MEKRIKATVVIATYNRPDQAAHLAHQIQLLNKDVEVIIVDQTNYPDRKVDHLTNGVKFCYLEIPNLAAARNIGLHSAHGEVVIFFDDDIEITAETIPAHLAAYTNSSVVAIAGRVINDHESMPANTDVSTGKTDFLKRSFLQQFWSTKLQQVDFPYGCNMSFRKETLMKIGCFDEYFNRVFDEIDIGLRIEKLGIIQFVPQALAYHHKAKTGGIREDEAADQGIIFRNYGHIIRKHVPIPFSLLTLALRSRSAFRYGIKSVKALYAGFLG